MTEQEKSVKRTSQTSRRKFLKDAGIIVGGATIGSLSIVSACNSRTSQPEAVGDNNTNNLTKKAMPNNNVSNTVNTTGNMPTNPPPVTKAADTANLPTAVDLELFNPSGDQEVTQFFAPRLNTLEGKTVAFLASDPTKWQPHRIFPTIMEELKKLYPTINFLPMDQFPMGTTISGDAAIKSVTDKHPDAVFIGAAG